MKNYLLHILLLVVSISCTQDNDQYINNDSQNKEMQFNVSLPDVATRSTSLINSREELDGMSVGLYAFRTDFEAPYSKELIADNIRLTYNETTSTWEYVDLAEPLRWNFKHMFDKFSFYVYYPYDENAAKVNFDMDNASFSIDYDAVADADVDVMIAELEDIVCPRGGVITIGLKHILSAISFNTDYTKPIEEVKFCSESTYTTMPKSGTASLSNGVVEWSNIQNYDTTYSDLLGNTPGNYVLIIPQTTQNKGDLYFEMSYNDGVTPVDTAAKIPALMEFKAGQIYTFKYKGSYAEFYSETGDLIIDVDVFNDLVGDGQGEYDYSGIGAIIDQINTNAEVSGEDIKLVIQGTVVDSDQAYHMLRYIVEGILPFTYPTQIRDNLEVHHFDFSQMVLPTNVKFPYKAFDDPIIRESLKTIKLPVMDDTNLLSSFLDGCTELETIEFAEGSTLTALQWQFCYGCTSLKNINLEVLTCLKEVSVDAFANCTALEEIKLPQSVKNIANNSFENCVLLSKINIPASVTAIGAPGGIAFFNCRSLYSYEHDGIAPGFVLEPRSDNSLINIGYQSFFQTNVQSLIDGETWWDGYLNDMVSYTGNQIFSTPQ